MPGDSGEPVVTTLVCLLHIRTRGCGCIERPAFPAPFVCRGRDSKDKPCAKTMRRDRGLTSERHCEERSDEAIHSYFLVAPWSASRSLSSGAHSRDPLARNDGFNISSSLRKQGPITPVVSGCSRILEQRLSTISGTAYGSLLPCAIAH